MGIKDTAYASLFDKKDLPYIYRLAEEIRATHNQDLVNDFNNTLDKRWNDHNPILEIGNKNIELLDVSKTDDLVVTLGLQRLCDQILGTSVNRWRFIQCGTGTTPATVSDVGFAGPIPIIDMTLSGWTEYAGTSLRFAAIGGESLVTATITEAGVFDTGTSQILNRCMFSSFPITHTVNVNGFVISFVIEFVPIM
jgi:hypothetical protein